MSARAPIARWTVPALFALAAAATAAHAAGLVADAAAHPALHAYVLCMYALLRTGVALAFALFTIGRVAPHRPARAPSAFLACAAAMLAVVLLSDPAPGTPDALILSGELIAVGFVAWLLVAVMTLGRCFGVLPEARGLVTAGPYGVVRHPVYLGEIGACCGLVLAAPSAANLLCVLALLGAQSARMRMEERALEQAFPEYAAYARATPRLLPRLRVRAAARVTPARAESPTPSPSV